MKTMENDRVSDAMLKAQGVDDGKRWAKNTATTAELQRLAEIPDELLMRLGENPGDAFGPGQTIAGLIDPDIEKDREGCRAFWDAVEWPDSDRLSDNLEYLHGFVEGALEVFSEVEG